MGRAVSGAGPYAVAGPAVPVPEHRPQPYRPSRRVLLGGFLGPSRQAGLYDTSFFRGAVCLTLVGKVKIAASALQLPMADIYLSLWVAIP